MVAKCEITEVLDFTIQGKPLNKYDNLITFKYKSYKKPNIYSIMDKSISNIVLVSDLFELKDLLSLKPPKLN